LIYNELEYFCYKSGGVFVRDDIIIRPITLDDTDNIIKWRNNPQVSENFIYRKGLTREDHIYWMKNKVETGKVAQFIIVEKESGKDIGSVYLRDIDYNYSKAEFGIFIGDEDAHGKGYGTQATMHILEYAFSELKLNKVFLRVFSYNAGAIRCYEKAGFTNEGCFRQDVIIDGKPYDIVFMGFLKSEWEAGSL
jgi:UDP-4-amino-4,6-dideoxy-N-acetyl-beta-L-altrosamine N-acetyltransferase